MEKKNLETSKGNIIIRLAEVPDAEAVRELRLEALLDKPEAFASTYASTVDRTIESWRERLSDEAKRRGDALIIADHQGQLIGMAGISRIELPNMAHSGIIISVYVKPEWRSLHISSALVEACCAWGKAQGLTHVRLEVITVNTAAIRSYSRIGFRVYGIDPQAILSNGVYYDNLLMVKVL